MHALTRSASLTDYEQVARSVGLDPFRMLRMAKLPARVLDDPNMMINAVRSAGCWRNRRACQAKRRSACCSPKRRSLANFGMLALVIREEPTLRAALQSCIRYMRLHNAGVQARLEDAGDVVLLHIGVNMQRHGVWRQAIEMSTGIGTPDTASTEPQCLPAGKHQLHSRAARETWKCTTACSGRRSNFRRNTMSWSVAAATWTCQSRRRTR